MTDWTPDNAWPKSGPPTAGALVAANHAVWRITKVTDQPLNDNERQTWLDLGMPDVDTWTRRPYTAELEWVAGAAPADDDGTRPYLGSITVRTVHYHQHRWHTYAASGRWPMCSCCGEPTPCRAELEDREVSRGLNEVEKHARKRPGHCWSCNEEITSRQKTVTYAGDNIDLPGAPSPRFHIRGKCGAWARAYEWRWIAEDPRRERILTWPKCGGILTVHADGSSECHGGTGPLGRDHATQADCRGHETHDHGTVRSCFVGDAWMEHPDQMPGCPRGCTRAAHRGTGALKRRPARRIQPTLTGGAA